MRNDDNRLLCGPLGAAARLHWNSQSHELAAQSPSRNRSVAPNDAPSNAQVACAIRLGTTVAPVLILGRRMMDDSSARPIRQTLRSDEIRDIESDNVYPWKEKHVKNQIDVYDRWRRGRDSNPRWAINPYTLSRRAPSAARTPLREVDGGGVPAAPRHPNPLRPLLPSGPDGLTTFAARGPIRPPSTRQPKAAMLMGLAAD